MLKQAHNTAHQTADDGPGFQFINRGYNSVFQPNHLNLGLVVPLETCSHGPAPTMTRHLECVQLAEQLRFAAVWLRDMPFNVPSFGDAGRMSTRRSISPLPNGARVFAPVSTISNACGKTRRHSRIPMEAHTAGWTCCPNRRPADCRC